MLRVHRWTARRVGFLAVEHERQRFVIHANQLGGVFGERARIGDDGCHPFAGIARHIDGERPPQHFWGVESRQ